MRTHHLKQYINYGLIASFVGVLFVFPFQHHFIGGLLLALFSAALIGGLADSFAVKALFGQPLGIKWPSWVGTNIIVRQRERLINELADMVQHELLSPVAIREAFKSKSIATIIENFVQSDEGEQTIKQMLKGAIRESVNSRHLALSFVSLKHLIGDHVQSSKPSHFIVKGIRFIFEHRLDDTAASFFFRITKPLIESDQFKGFIQGVIQQAINKYEQNNRRRQVANQIANINAEKLAQKLIDYVESYAFELVAGDHPFRVKMKEAALLFAHRLESDEDYSTYVDERIQSILHRLLSTSINSVSINEILSRIEQELEADDEQAAFVRMSETATNKLYNTLSIMPLSQYDDVLLNWLVKLVESKQDMIGLLVQEKLQQYSAEDLVLLVEEKAGKDLQFIRLNGTVIGGFIGALLYILQSLLGGELL